MKKTLFELNTSKDIQIKFDKNQEGTIAYLTILSDYPMDDIQIVDSITDWSIECQEALINKAQFIQ